MKFGDADFRIHRSGLSLPLFVAGIGFADYAEDAVTANDDAVLTNTLHG